MSESKSDALPLGYTAIYLPAFTARPVGSTRLSSTMAPGEGFEPPGLPPQKISSLRPYDHLGILAYGADGGIRTHAGIRRRLTRPFQSTTMGHLHLYKK